MQTFLQNLPANINPSQWQAIRHQGSHLLIVAGPGTGKTHTLTYRMAQVASHLADQQKILAITFTNKAADEMRQRLQKLNLLNERPFGFVQGERSTSNEEQIFVGTFHSFCLKILRQFYKEAGLPKDFSVLDPLEVEAVIKEVFPQCRLRERRILLERISQIKTRGDGPQDEDIAIYNKKLREKGMLDFDDLLSETLRLFQRKANVLAEIQKTFVHIFVDEYQDINSIQHELLKSLVGKEVFLTAIGDPNQAIYGFRGADVRFFGGFSADFPGAVILSLRENYRSAKNILSASTQVIGKARSQFVPDLIARIYHEGRLTIYEAMTDKAEVEFVVHQIEKLVGGTSLFSKDTKRITPEDFGERSFGDMAVLYRLNSQRRTLQEALDRGGIPYRVSGPKSKELFDQVCPLRGEDIEIDSEKVSLLTLHAAKGLEFPVVFIVGCENNLLPLNLEGMKSNPEEERRLFYVGMTRAKERLYLIYSKRRNLFGKTYENEPSEFLADIEGSLKEYEEAVKKFKRRKKDKDQMKLF